LLPFQSLYFPMPRKKKKVEWPIKEWINSHTKDKGRFKNELIIRRQKQQEPTNHRGPNS
jgi:hypothetical protein